MLLQEKQTDINFNTASEKQLIFEVPLWTLAGLPQDLTCTPEPRYLPAPPAPPRLPGSGALPTCHFGHGNPDIY